MKKLIPYIFILVCHMAFSQSLEKKWNNMIDKSNSYNTHKIIKGDELHDMWTSVQDSMTSLRLKIRQEQMRLNVQASEIANLNNKVNAANTRVSEITKERDKLEASASSSDSYIAMLWVALGLILLACSVLFLLYKKSNDVTSQKKHDYDQLSKAFEDYKNTKLELERKLKREIQTYSNKLEELKIKL